MKGKKYATVLIIKNDLYARKQFIILNLSNSREKWINWCQIWDSGFWVYLHDVAYTSPGYIDVHACTG